MAGPGRGTLRATSGPLNAFMTISGEPPVDLRAETYVRSDEKRAHAVPWLCLAVVVVSALASTATVMSVGTMAVVFICSVVAAVAGFAFSALAGAVLFHVDTDPIRVVSVLLVSSLAGAIYTVWSTRRSIDWRELAPYVLGGAIAVPPGVLLLLNTRADAYLPALGCFLFVYGAYALVGSPLSVRHDGIVVRLLVGFAGGLTGALAAFPAAFVVVWCRAQGLDKHRQLLIVQPFILLIQVMVLATLAVLRPMQEALPLDLIQFVAPAILGTYGGLAIRHLLSTRQFNSLIGVLLVLSGLILVSRAFYL
jgi:uncharacterized membrane protein YfcA